MMNRGRRGRRSVGDLPTQSFGQLLRALRLKSGASQAAIAELLNVTQGYISYLEHNRRQPPEDEVIGKIAQRVNATADELEDLLQLAAAQRRRASVLQPALTELDDLHIQSNASVVWVISKLPLEIDEAVYRDETAKFIALEGKQYVYWCCDEITIQVLRGLLLDTIEVLLQREQGENASRSDAQDLVQRNVKFVLTPSTANWFSGAIYDPFGHWQPRGHQLIEPENPSTGDMREYRYQPIAGKTMQRMLQDLEAVYRTLFILGQESTTHAGTWKRLPSLVEGDFDKRHAK